MDIYHPYVYHSGDFDFDFYKQNIKLNLRDLIIMPHLPSGRFTRGHNHHEYYRTSFNNSSGFQYNNLFSAEHSFRNLNLDPGDYTFIFEIIAEVGPFLYNNKELTFRRVNTSNGITLKNYNHQYVDNLYNKAVIQFTSNGIKDGRIYFRFQQINSLYDS